MQMRTGSLGGMVATALLWAVVWAFPGGVIEAIDNIAPSAHGFTRQIDMWMQTLGLPGLVAGVVFSVLLLITEGRRGLAEVSLPRTGAWGCVAGLLVGGLVVWGLDSGLSEPAWLAAAVLGYATVMGAAAATASTLIFRHVGRRRAAAIS